MYDQCYSQVLYCNVNSKEIYSKCFPGLELGRKILINVNYWKYIVSSILEIVAKLSAGQQKESEEVKCLIGIFGHLIS